MAPEIMGLIDFYETPEMRAMIDAWIADFNKEDNIYKARRSRPGDFQCGWSPVYFEQLRGWERFKHWLRSLLRD